MAMKRWLNKNLLIHPIGNNALRLDVCLPGTRTGAWCIPEDLRTPWPTGFIHASSTWSLCCIHAIHELGIDIIH